MFCLCAALNAQPIATPQIQLAVTNGLIRWWPNLFDVRDVVTGQEGVVMGVLPPVETGADDETEFDRNTSWVRLQPAITNEVFTLAFWVCPRPNPYSRLIGQESSEGEWYFQTERSSSDFVIGREPVDERDRIERVQLAHNAWHHVSIARRVDGTSVVWVNGVRSLDGRAPHLWPCQARWLTVGDYRSEHWFFGRLRDLCAFDRVLADEEVRELQAGGVPKRPARNTVARLAATTKALTTAVSTNVVKAPTENWTHRCFTTEDGLPGNIVKAVLQARNGYLWVGTEEGLARFDGRQFRAFTAENTPAMKAIGQTVWSLAEDADGTIWAGIFGGLLRIRNLEFTALTNGLPQRFVLRVEPAGDGSVWVAGFNAFVPRGPCWLRRYHPDSGASSAGVVVPGHIRRLVVVTNGVWLATEQPQQMHFWDGHSAATTVVGTVDQEPPTIRLASKPALPSDPHVRAWKDCLESTNWWAEVSLGREGPSLNWLWDPKLARPWAARWNGPAGDDVWLGVSYDLARLRGGQLEKIKIADHAPGPEITCLCANREGGVWFGTEEDGLHFVQERLIRVYTTQDGLMGNDVRSVSATAGGGLWVATTEGLSRCANDEWTQHGKGALRAIASDRQGQPWFGVAEFGPDALRRDSAESRKLKVVLGLEWQDPNSLRFARDGTLWVACERGLTWLKPERLVRLDAENWVPDPASTQPAFGRYEVGKELPKIFPLGLVEDGDGSIWTGSLANGLFHVRGERVETFTEKDGLPGKHCVPVHRDDSGALWIVAERSLSRRSDDRFQNIGEKEGLPKDVLLDLIEDDFGNFWISGKRGIHRIVRRELEEFFAGRLSRVQSLTLGIRDGLLTPECSSLHYRRWRRRRMATFGWRRAAALPRLTRAGRA
jgi:ligand-binding sensor domain-containing protein